MTRDRRKPKPAAVGQLLLSPDREATEVRIVDIDTETRNLRDLIAATKLIESNKQPSHYTSSMLLGLVAIIAGIAFAHTANAAATTTTGTAAAAGRSIWHLTTINSRQDQRSAPESEQLSRNSDSIAPSYHQLTSQDLASADQLDDPSFMAPFDSYNGRQPQTMLSGATSGSSGSSGSFGIDSPDEPASVLSPMDSSSSDGGGGDSFSASELAQESGHRGSRLASASLHRGRHNGDEQDEHSASSSFLHSSAPSLISSSSDSGGGGGSEDEAMDQTNAQDVPDRNVLINDHNSHLRAMRDMFERRQMAGGGNGNNNHHHFQNQHRQHSNQINNNNNNPLQPNSQELSPISIGLDPSPFAMPSPFQLGDGAGPPPPAPMPMPKANQMADEVGNVGGGAGPDGGLGPALPFLSPLPQLLGFQSSPFDGPQRGDQSAHSNHHAAAAPSPDVDMAPVGGAGGQKVWPRIFRFQDGRINLSDFEKQKKIRLSNKSQHGGENHIESAPVIFDRPLKRKSFLILHGGVFQV